MIVRKTLEITTEDINSVVLELANEIKSGYKIAEVSTRPFTCSRDPRHPVVAEVILVKESTR